MDIYFSVTRLRMMQNALYKRKVFSVLNIIESCCVVVYFFVFDGE